MKIRNLVANLIILILIVEAGIFSWYQLHSSVDAQTPVTQTASVKNMSSQITADGTVTAQNQATLHFQTGGKLTELPVKEGDKVYQGQTIAQLDNYQTQRLLTQALNTYKLARDANQQSQADQQSHVTQDTQASKLKGIGAEVGAGSYGTVNGQTSYIDDTVKRIADENQATLDNSVAAIEIANYSLQLSTLTSPLNGIVTHEDVTVPFVNVSPTTSFTVADPTSLVFRAKVPDYQIDYVTEGAQATIYLDGNKTPIQGTVAKIYPSKVSMSGSNNSSGDGSGNSSNDGEAYQVDIQTSNTSALGKMDQTGNVFITSNAKQDTMLVPGWTVIGGKYIWVSENKKPVLKSIKTGKTHGSDVEILSGLSSQDRIITDPKSIPQKEYPIL
ncbi:MAG: efflux RND transporter periplasmic adaptor subunit [Candidatus Levyibacteriota bacterium]